MPLPMSFICPHDTVPATVTVPSPGEMLKSVGASVLHALKPVAPELPAIVGLLVGLAILRKVLKGSRTKGKIGEAAVRWALSRLDKTRYRTLANVYIPSGSGVEGGMTELDHVVVGAHGIFVIETKNYGGCIYGREEDRKWTATYGRRKHSFLNPVRQNEGHVRALAAFLGLPREVFHSVVFFFGDAKLKTKMPAHVLTTGLRRHIKSKRDVLLDEAEVAEAWDRLSAHDAAMDKRIVGPAHVARLRSM